MAGYYIAAKVQEPERNRLPDLQQRAHDTAHMTLVYLGPLTPKELKQTKSVLKQISKKHRDFSAPVVGFANFAGSDKRGIYHAEVKQVRPLMDLQSDLKSKLPKIGDSRPYHPHVTLDPNHAGPFVQESVGKFKVNEISLLQENKNPKTIHSYRLRDSNVFQKVWDKLTNG